MKIRKLELFFAVCMLAGVLIAPRAQEDGFWGTAWNGILHVVDGVTQGVSDMFSGMFGVGTTPGSGGYGGGGGSGFPD